MNFKNQLGATVLESALILAVLLPAVGTGFTLATSSGLKVLASHLLYEGVICLAEGEKSSVCKRKLRRQLKKVMPFGQCQRLLLTSGPYHLRGDLVWKIGIGIQIHIHHQIPRHLEKS